MIFKVVKFDNIKILPLFLLKTKIMGTGKNRLSMVVLTFTNNLCLRAEVRNIMIQVWFEGALIILACEPRHEKTNVLISDLVRHKPGCTATEDG